MYKNRLPMSLMRAMPRIAGAVILAAACSSHVAAENERGKQQQLVAGLAYIAPEYVAGAKFRTPESIDAVLAENLAKRLSLPLKLVPVDTSRHADALTKHKADVLVTPLLADPGNAFVAVPSGYQGGPMAIMRTDTTIKQASQLQGRKVCVSEGSPYVGTIARKYGAIEQVYKAPADSLLALRIGVCDAAVHDSAMLTELLKLPEWKKFSASIQLAPPVPLVFIVRSDDAKLMKAARQISDEWKKNDFLSKELTQKVRHIAFEVYLDQNVPDCH